MNKLLNKIFETKSFINNKGETVLIHSETSKAQCEFLQNIIRQNKFTKSIEIGFAYGISTLAIAEQIVDQKGTHLVIDKFQHKYWNGNGLDLIKQAGYFEHLQFIEEFSYIALPELLQKDLKFDFAYVDTTKLFDWVLVDFFYLDKLLDINGVVVFDDMTVPAIRKLVRYISQLPNYKIYDQFPENFLPSKLLSFAKILTKLPKSSKYIKSEIKKSDFDLGINTFCLALQKTGDDKRYYDWHVDF